MLDDLPTHPDFNPESQFTPEQLADIFQLTEEDKRILNESFPGDWAPRYEMTGSQLMAATFPPVEWVIPGIIPQGYTILAAPPKAGKSWLVLDTAIALSTAGKTLGAYQVDEARPVLYLALEDTFARLQKRLSLLEYEGTNNLTVRIHLEGEPYEEVISRWLEGKEAQKPFVIVDTLGKIRPPSEASYAADYHFSASLKTLIDPIPGGALWAVHHTRQRTLGQPTGDFLESVSGTSGITGAADTIAVIARERHELEAVLAVTGRDVEEAQFAITFDQGRWVIDPRHPHPERDTANDPVAFVQSLGTASFEAIKAHSPGLTLEAVQKRLKRAIDAGQLRREGNVYITV